MTKPSKPTPLKSFSVEYITNTSEDPIPKLAELADENGNVDLNSAKVGEMFPNDLNDDEEEVWGFHEIEQQLVSHIVPQTGWSHLGFPMNNLLITINSSEMRKLIPEFEYRLIHFFNLWCYIKYWQSKDLLQVEIYNHLLPSLFLTEEVVQRAIYTYLSMIYLTRFGSQYLLASNALAAKDPKVTHAYKFGITHFDKLIQLVTKLTDSLKQGKLPTERLLGLFLALSIMYSILGFHPLLIGLLVDFETKNDLVTIVRGMWATVDQSRDQLRESRIYQVIRCLQEAREQSSIPMDIERETFHMKVSTVPCVSYFFDQLYSMGYDKTTTESLIIALRSVNASMKQCVEWNSPVSFFRFLIHSNDSFYELVYEKNPIALAVMAMACSVFMISKYWFDQDENHWIRFVKWYKLHCENMYGTWKFSWEKAMYELAVVEKWTFEDPRMFKELDFDRLLENVRKNREK